MRRGYSVHILRLHTWAGQRTVEGKNGKNYEIGQANR
jgi:hypothetical protein